MRRVKTKKASKAKPKTKLQPDGPSYEQLVVDPRYMSINQITRHFDVTKSLVRKWITEGMPRVARGVYDPEAIQAWITKNQSDSPNRRGPSTATTTKSSLELRKLTAETIKREIELRKAQEEVVEIGDYDRVLTETLTQVAAGLDDFPDRWSERLLNISDYNKMFSSLEKAMKEVREKIRDAMKRRKE